MRDPFPEADCRTLVVGLGNLLRGDDAVGIEVARRVRELVPGLEVIETEAEPTRLIDLWGEADCVVVVDAAQGTGAAGTVTTIDVQAERLPHEFFSTSTHHVSLGEVVELARALDLLPGCAHVVAVEGAGFDTGAGLSPAVEAAIPAAVAEVVRCTSEG